MAYHQINNYPEFENFIYNQLPRSPQKSFTSGAGIAKTAAFLKLLDNPQEKISIIHIAGTSGKGSVAHITSQLLASQGFKVGLHISPHISDLRERFQVLDPNKSTSLLSKDAVLQHFQPFHQTLSTQFSQLGHDSLTYFEILTCFAFYIFHQEQVNYAVIETGLGGTYDATNVVSNPQKISVINPINYDHMNILGNTIPEIASQKAGIIQPHNTVIASPQLPAALHVIEQRVTQQHATLLKINKSDFQVDKITIRGTSFSYKEYPEPIHTNLIGTHQAQNITVALRTLQVLSQRGDLKLDYQKANQTLKHITIPGRLEIFKLKLPTLNHKPSTLNLIVDGAHNPHKMTALTSSLKQLFPEQQLNFLLAFKANKDILPMLKLVTPLAHHLLLTTFTTTEQDFLPEAADPHKIAQQLQTLGFTNYTIETNPHQALQNSLNHQTESTPLIITGSFYLISQLYPILQRLKTQSTTQ